MRKPHFFQKCCHFLWNQNKVTFEKNEDCATVFLKWTEYTNIKQVCNSEKHIRPQLFQTPQKPYRLQGPQELQGPQGPWRTQWPQWLQRHQKPQGFLRSQRPKQPQSHKITYRP